MPMPRTPFAASKNGPTPMAYAKAMTVRRSAHLVIVIAALCLGSAYARPVGAMTSQGALGDVLFGEREPDDRHAAPPPVARYVSDEGESFVLDRTSPTPLLKFEESQEVFVLRPSPAARGDIIYRDDLGEPVLRATKLGGLTLFYRGRPGGAPAAFAGQATTIHLQGLSPGAAGEGLRTKTSWLSSNLSRGVGLVRSRTKLSPSSET